MSIKKVLHRANISLPEIQTLIKEVQAVVNDRPIICHDVNDPEPVTPPKLLYGLDVTALSHSFVDPEELDNENVNERNKLSKVMKRRSLLFQHFVQRSKNGYLTSLRERHVYQSNKKGSQEEDISGGDAILIHDNNVPRSLWKIAIVKKVILDSDGQVRAADIQKSSESSPTAQSVSLGCQE